MLRFTQLDDFHAMKCNQQPLISVAVCTYNGERFLREQLDSLIRQDYPNLEIIVSDDCSSDATLEILEEYAETHTQITVFQNSSNLGFVRNFEKCLRLCSGQYIALCDQDDIWFPEKISSLYNEIGSADLIYSAVELIDHAGTKLSTPFPNVNRIEGRCHLALLFSNCVTGHTCLFKTQLLESALPIPSGVKLHDQWIAFVAASRSGIKASPRVLSYYRKHDNNVVFGKKDSRKTECKKAKAKRKQQENINFLRAASELPTLSNKDRTLITRIRKAYEIAQNPFVNSPLKSILINEQDSILPIYKNRKKAIKKLTRGPLVQLFS
jgi:glycosyltransferase involved in cell wall biosynthesis